VLRIALNEWLPDSYKLLPSAGHPGPDGGRRRSLRVAADRRAACTGRPGCTSVGLAEWLADRQRQADLYAERARAGAVGERRAAEALRAQATDPDPAAGRQELGDPPAEPPARARDREPEDDLGDSWRTYRERDKQIRRTYGWTAPEPRPRAEPWQPLGRDYQERDSDGEDR
jgi:hypothetical protein